MSFYDDHILPPILDLVMRQRPFMRQRAKVVPSARGRVLEIGIGTGLNLGFYDPEKVEGVWGVDPAAALSRRAERRAENLSVPVNIVGLSGGEIQMEDNTFDTAVMTYTLCSIAEKAAALQQMRRVLKPSGRLLFIEHGKAPDAAVAHLQARLNPLWKRVAGGCHLDVNVPQVLSEHGFEAELLEANYIPGPRFASFNYWGSATAR